MVRTILIVAIAVLAVSWAGGCTKTVPLTSDLISEYELSPLDLKQLQYYVSDAVVMAREVTKSEAKREDSGLKWKKDKYVHEVIIKKNLPGIAEAATSNVLSISFEAGSMFRFMLDTERGGRFYMTPDRISGGAYIFDYNGHDYTAFSTRYVYLLVEMDGLSKFRKEKKSLDGRRVGDD